MPTTVVKKIGTTNSPVVCDYATLQSWTDGAPTDLVAADQVWRGECYDQGKFTSGVNIGSGHTVDATRYFVLTCATGQSFKDKPGVRTTALNYNATTGSGVSLDMSAAGNVTVSAPYTVLDGLQLRNTGYSLAVNVVAANVIIRNCIATRTGGASSVIQDAVASTKWQNVVVVYNFSTGNASDITGSLYNCTFVNAGGSAGTSSATNSEYNIAVAVNCAFFGFSRVVSGSATFGASSDYNATDNSSVATGGGGGTHNVASLTFASQFTSTTSDFRAVSGSGLHAGTPDATNSPTDITGTARNATTPYIGAWEATAPASGFTISPPTIPKNHAGNITLTLTGSSTSWANGTTVFTPSGVTGVTKVSQSVTSATAATVVVTTDATHTGTLTLTESVTGTSTATTTIGTATVAVSPSSVTVSTTPTITLTGTSTVWSQETAAGLFSVSGVSGVSIGTPTVTSNTAATATVTAGSSTGTVTLADNSTGATTTFTVATISGSITLTSPVAFRGVWRNPATGHGDIPIAGTYTGGPGTLTIQASFNGGAYATVATGSAGSFAGTLTGQSPGIGTLTVRFVNAPTISATVANVAIGAVIGIAGQSNAAGELDNPQVYANGSGLKAVCYKAGNTSYSSPSFWDDATDPFPSGSVNGNLTPAGSPWPLLATHLMADLGYPVIFVETAIGGRVLCWYWTKFRPDTGAAGSGSTGPTTGYGEIAATCSAAATGGMDAMIWYQGEGDCDAGIARTVYGPALQAFANNIASDVTGAPKLAVVQFGHDGSASAVPASQADAIKLALSDAVNAGGNVLNGMVVVSDFSTGLHVLTDSEGQKVADRMFAVLKSEVFGGTAGNGRGPRVVGCQHDAARTSITVGFDKALKAGRSHTASLWGVTGNGSAASVSSVAYHGTDPNALVLTLASAAATPILVSFAQGGSTASGKVWPAGPDFTLPASAGTINLPAEPFSGVRTTPAVARTHPVRNRIGSY